MPAQKSRLLSSEGVASKRDFFERSAPSKAEPAALRKVRPERRWAGTGCGANLPRFACQAQPAGTGARWVPELRWGTGAAPARRGFLPGAGRRAAGMEPGCGLGSARCSSAPSPRALGTGPGYIPAGGEPLLQPGCPSVPQDSLKIPGSVTSRINLWISRAQEPAKEENSKVPPCVNLK